MQRQTVSNYLEQQILSATPLEVVSLSYQTAIQAVRDARRQMAEHKILDRLKSVALAHKILAHLYRSLDFTAGGGDLPRELGRLYEYMMRRLLEANARQQEEPLEEVLGLLTTLGEAWQELAKKPASSAPVQVLQPWEIPADGAEQSRYSWSF